MDPLSEHVQVRTVGDRIVIHPVGLDIETLYESSLITEIGKAMYDTAEANPGRKLIVNLEAVRYASTEMIAKLVSLSSRVERAGGRLKLCCLQPDVHESMRILKLLSLFELADTESEALGVPDPELWRTTVEIEKLPKPAPPDRSE